MRAQLAAACIIALVAASSLAEGPRPGLRLPPVPGKSIPGDAVPTRFFLGIGGFSGPNYSLSLTGGTLTYRTQVPDENSRRFVESSTVVEPTPGQWREFWKAMDDVGLWSWKPAYDNPNVLDGTSWGVDVAVAGRSVRSQGKNRYPGGAPNVVPERSPEFERFLAAVETLAGGRTFR